MTQSIHHSDLSRNRHHLPLQAYDAVVVGLGGMGSATLLELALRGQRVLGIEQFHLNHNRGSSHGQTRVIRTAYYEHPSYVPLVQRAFTLWYRLERLSGKHLLTECPCLSIGKPEGELIQGIEEAARLHSLDIDRLTASEIHHRFPAFEVPRDYVGIQENQAGFLAVEDCVRCAIESAIDLGATIATETQVLSWQVDGRGVRVSTSQGDVHAARLILTAGPWTGQLLQATGIPLTLMRQILLWYGTQQDEIFTRNRFPVFLAETENGYYYGVPMIDRFGPKVAQHYGQPEHERPEDTNRNVTSEDERSVRGFLNQYIPRISGPLRRSETCIYTLTPDRDFILDHHPDFREVIFGAGFSGHGFKFASVVGEILADLAMEGKTRHDISRFGLSRFSKINRPN